MVLAVKLEKDYISSCINTTGIRKHIGSKHMDDGLQERINAVLAASKPERKTLMDMANELAEKIAKVEVRRTMLNIGKRLNERANTAQDNTVKAAILEVSVAILDGARDD